MSRKLNISYCVTHDLDLWQDLKSGDKNALDHIYYAQVSALMAYGRQFTANAALVDDCIQELFVDIWIKRERLGDVSSIRFYLIKSLKRRLLRTLKQEGKSQCFSDMGEYFNDAVAMRSFTVQSGERDNSQLLQSLEKLSELQKEIIFLKFFNGLTFDEIGEVLDLNKKQLYNALAKAMSKLRQLMGVLFLIFSSTL